MKFAYYGFEFAIPKDWNVTFDKKTNYSSGMVNFETPGKLRMEHIWDSLDKYSKKHATLEAFMKSYFDGLRANKTYKDLNVIEEASNDGDHEVSRHEFSYSIKQPFSKPVPNKVLGMTMYCKSTNRFIIVFSSLNQAKENIEEPLLKDAMRSFSCVHE